MRTLKPDRVPCCFSVGFHEGARAGEQRRAPTQRGKRGHCRPAIQASRHPLPLLRPRGATQQNHCPHPGSQPQTSTFPPCTLARTGRQAQTALGTPIFQPRFTVSPQGRSPYFTAAARTALTTRRSHELRERSREAAISGHRLIPAAPGPPPPARRPAPLPGPAAARQRPGAEAAGGVRCGLPSTPAHLEESRSATAPPPPGAAPHRLGPKTAPAWRERTPRPPRRLRHSPSRSRARCEPPGGGRTAAGRGAAGEGGGGAELRHRARRSGNVRHQSSARGGPAARGTLGAAVRRRFRPRGGRRRRSWAEDYGSQGAAPLGLGRGERRATAVSGSPVRARPRAGLRPRFPRCAAARVRPAPRERGPLLGGGTRGDGRRSPGCSHPVSCPGPPATAGPSAWDCGKKRGETRPERGWKPWRSPAPICVARKNPRLPAALPWAPLRFVFPGGLSSAAGC